MYLLTLISAKKHKKKLFINVLNELKSNNNMHVQKSPGHKS